MDSVCMGLDQSSNALADVYVNTIPDIAQNASKEQIIELDKIMRELAGEQARMVELKTVLSDIRKNKKTPDAVIALVESEGFGDKQAKDAFMDCDAYKEFVGKYQDIAPEIGQGLDEDEVGCFAQHTSDRDPITQTLLEYDAKAKKYPIAMPPCNHVYNYSTVMSKNSRGLWTLSKCAVAGCNSVFNIPKRDDLKEHVQTKHLIKKRQRNLGSGSKKRKDTETFNLDDEED